MEFSFSQCVFGIRFVIVFTLQPLLENDALSRVFPIKKNMHFILILFFLPN